MELPKRGDVWAILDKEDGAEQQEIYICAIDSEEGIWVGKDTATGELMLMTFDENGNSSYIDLTLEEKS